MPNDDFRLDEDLKPIMLSQREKNAKRPPLTSIEPKLMRKRASEEFVPWNEGGVEIAEIRDFEIPSEDCQIPLRLYDDSKGKNTGVLIYFHGGGWIIGDLELEDYALRLIAKESGVKILSVDYRLAPEHPFPACLIDAEAVYKWVKQNAHDFSINANKISFGGSSAGANVAMGAILRIRDNLGETPKHAALIHGVFGRDYELPSYKDFGDGRFGLPRAAMEFFWNNYMAGHKDHPHANILLDNLEGLNTDFIILESELDVLADESAELARRLKAKNYDVKHIVYKGAIHGFTQYAKAAKIGRNCLMDIAADLKEKIF